MEWKIARVKDVQEAIEEAVEAKTDADGHRYVQLGDGSLARVMVETVKMPKRSSKRPAEPAAS